MRQICEAIKRLGLGGLEDYQVLCPQLAGRTPKATLFPAVETWERQKVEVRSLARRLRGLYRRRRRFVRGGL